MVAGAILRAEAMAAAQAMYEILGSPVRKLATVKLVWARLRLASVPLR